MAYRDDETLASLILGNPKDVGSRQKRAIVETPTSNTRELIDTSPQGFGETFAESVRGGGAQLTADFNRFKGIGNLIIGDDEAAQRNLAIAESYDDYSSELLGQIQPFEEFLDEPTFGGFLTQITKAIGQFTPMAVSSVASGFGGAAAGMLGKGGLRLAGKKGADKLYKDVLEKKARNEVLTPDENVILNEGFGYLKWAKRGGITGAFGQEYVVGSSQAASEYQEAGIDLTAAEAAQAFLLGIPQAVLGTASETIFARALLKNALKKSPLVALERKAQTMGTANLSKNEKKMYDLFQKYKKSGEESLTESQRAVLKKYSGPQKNAFFTAIKDIGKGFASSGATEGITEVGQEGLGIAQRFAIDDEYSARDAKLRLAEAAFAGFFAGGARGGAGGAATSIISKANNLLSTGLNEQGKNKTVTEIINEVGNLQNTEPKNNNQVQGELNLNKNTILLPGVTEGNYREVYSGIDFGDKDTVLPYKGQGVVLGTKESLQEATNYHVRNKAKESNNQELTIGEQQEYQQAIIKALDSEELVDVVDNPTHMISVKDNDGNVVAQKQVSTTPEELSQAVTELQQKYPNTQVEAFAMEDTRNMIDPNDPDIDAMDDLELDDDTSLDDPDTPRTRTMEEVLEAAENQADRNDPGYQERKARINEIQRELGIDSGVVAGGTIADSTNKDGQRIDSQGNPIEASDTNILKERETTPESKERAELRKELEELQARQTESITDALDVLGGVQQGGQFGQQLEEAKLTMAPELVARTQSQLEALKAKEKTGTLTPEEQATKTQLERGNTNQTYQYNDPLTYKKTNYEPRPETKEGKQKTADEELIEFRKKYLDELESEQEKTYWGGVEQDVNSPRMKTLSLSLLKAYFQQQTNTPDIAIVSTPSDPSTYSLVTRMDPNLQLAAIKTVEKAALESLNKNKKTGQSQAVPGFKIRITNGNAPTTLGYGAMQFLFANQDVAFNMHTLLYNGLQIFPEINLELNTIRNQLLESGLSPSQAFTQAFVSVAPEILEAYKAQGFEVVVQKDFGVQNSEFVSLDESPIALYELPMLYRIPRSSGAPTQFMSLRGILEDADNITSAKKSVRERFADYAEILNNLKEDPDINLFGPALIERAKAQYAEEGGDMSIFYTPEKYSVQGIVGKLNEIQKLNKIIYNPNLKINGGKKELDAQGKKEFEAIKETVKTYNQELNQTLGREENLGKKGDFDPDPGDGQEADRIRRSSAAQDLRVEGPTGAVPEMTTQILDGNGEPIVLRPQPAQERTLPASEYEIGQKRDEFIQTQERVQTTPTNVPADVQAREQQRAEGTLEKITLLNKVISGGQNGADILFSRVAKALGIATGGLMPKGFKTLGGNRPGYAQEFNMEESSSDNYRTRTEENVRNSDGTIILVKDANNLSRGSQLTKNTAERLKKPVLVITENTTSQEIQNFIRDNNIKTLNGAGSREQLLGDTSKIEQVLTEALGGFTIPTEPEVNAFEGTSTFNPAGVEVNLNNVEAGVEASPDAAAIFDLPDSTEFQTTNIDGEVVRTVSVQEKIEAGESFIDEMNRTLKDLFKITSKTFIVTAEESVNLSLKNPDGTELQTMNSDGEVRTVAEAIRQTQQEMIEKNHPGMAHRFAGGQINIIVINPKALQGTNKTANDIAATFVLGHELGHVIFREEMTRLGLDAFGQRTDKKVNKADERTGQLLFKEFKKVEDQYATRGFPFEEWYADRMSQFLLGQREGTLPLGQTPIAPSVVKYFQRLVKKIKQLWQSFDKRIRARYGEVNPVFNDYANGVVAAYRNGLTRNNITASVTEQADIRNWVDSTSKMVGKMVGKKNATRFSALAKKILRSEFAKDVRGFFTYILAPADNYLRLVNPELAKALYSRSQTTEATGFFNYHPVVQYRYTNDFYKIFNIEKDPTTADLERIDSVLEGAEQLAALPQEERAAAADNLTVLDKDGNSIQVDGAEALEVLKFFDTFYEDYILKNELDPNNPTVVKNMVFFTRQYDIAKLAAEPEAREALAKVLQKYNPTDTFESLLASVEAMVANAESSDAIRLEGAADLSIGMQKDRQKKFVNITNNADLRNIEGIGDLIIPAHHAIRKYIAENVKKVEFKNKVSTTLTQGDFANGRNKLEKFDVGERVSGPKAAEVMVNRIDNQRDRGRARKAVQAMLGKAGMNMPGWLRTTQSYLLALNVMTYLTFATVASLPDLAGPVLRSKEMSIFGKEFRTQIANYFTNRKEMEQFARDVGVIGFDSISQMYINAGELGYMTEGTKYYTQQFFKYTGLEWYTNFTRIYAAGMGRQFLIKHANDNSVKSKEYLAELGATAEQIKAAQESGWDFSDPQHKAVQDAIARFTEESIVRPNAAERPAWASNPYTALIFQLKSFFYAYGKNIIGGVIRNTQSTYNREGKISAAAMPAIFAATALLPLAMIGMELRELLKYFLSPISGAIDFNDKTEAFSFDSSKFRTNDMGYGEWLLEAGDRSGGFGAYTMLFPMFEAGRFGDEFYTSLLGPTAQRFEDIIKGDVQTKDFLPGFASVY